MRCFVAIFLVLPVILAGCGGSSSGVLNTSPVYADLSGNWNFILTPSNQLSFGPILGGYLASANGSVAGTLHANGSSCYPVTQDIPVTGSVTPAGVLTLRSATVAGQILSMSGNAFALTGSSSDAISGVFSGTYTISGGCAAGENGTVAGTLISPVNGDYAGSLRSDSGLSIGVNFDATQTGPNADGEYGVSGTVSFSGSLCFSTGTITSSTIYGQFIDVTIAASNGGTMQFTGEILDTEPMTIDGLYSMTAGNCAGDLGGGTLTKL